jgi:formylglycine-generating enzyme required for sulfatase activity
MAQPRPIRLFISYAHKDEPFRKELEMHLGPLKRQNVVEIWSDRAIEPGQEWEKSISEQLSTADIILLLISPDFLASEYIYDKELTRAMERHETSESRVIPVFLRPCDWKGEPFGKLQGVPDDAKSVTKWADRDEAFTLVAQAVRKAAEILSCAHASCALEPTRTPLLAVERTPFFVFRDHPLAPEMVVVPPGEVLIGSPNSDRLAMPQEKPQHLVQIACSLAVGRYPVTFAEWDACVAHGGIGHVPNDHSWGRERRPVVNVSWADAQQYLSWLSRKTGQIYRLLSEAEWEYTARSGTMARYWWGDEITPARANYQDSELDRTTVVGNYPESPFKLCDMIGNVWEWTEDCWNDNYAGAPTDGSAWTAGDCRRRVIRGGSWTNDARNVRCASRGRYLLDGRDGNVGFRIARKLARSG